MPGTLLTDIQSLTQSKMDNVILVLILAADTENIRGVFIMVQYTSFVTN